MTQSELLVLKAKIDQLRKVIYEKQTGYSFSATGARVKAFKDLIAKESVELQKLWRTYRLHMAYTCKTIDTRYDRGSLMTIAQFVDLCKNERIEDHDGYGQYATATEISNITFIPSDTLHNKVRTDFTHMMWFNK